MGPETPHIMIVDDEEDIASTYRRRLTGGDGPEYDITMVHRGDEALEQLDDSVDVMLLDRRMPGLSGSEVAEFAREENIDVRIAMVTAVELSLEDIGIEFDAYIEKPPAAGELQDVVQTLLERDGYAASFRELYSLLEKKSQLKESHSEESLESSERFQELNREIREKQQEIHEEMQEKDDDQEVVALFRQLTEQVQEV